MLAKGFLLAITTAATLFGQTPGVPEMLEKALQGVVTVAVNETTQTSAILGAASASRLDQAYEQALDLSDAKGSGSGFLITRGGKTWLVTNAHVIEHARADEIYAYSINQTKYKLQFFGGDSFYDIALLEFVDPAVPGPEISPLEFRDSDIKVGESVYALGNPLGEFPYSVSDGIVGGKNRLLSGWTGRMGYLQHTATIIWGNSGGPLIDNRGRVVGINSRIEIAPNTEHIQPQINFALDGRLSARLVDQLIAGKGRLVRAYLGLELSQSVEVNRFRRTVTSDTVIESVVPNGPAAELAKYVGARVDRIGTRTIRNLDEAMVAVEELKPGQSVEFELTRSGVTDTLTIRTSALTDEMRTLLARHTMRSHLNIDVADTADGLVLKVGAPSGTRNQELTQFRPPRQKAPSEPPKAPAAELLVVAVGFINEDEPDGEPLLYRISDSADLASGLRLLLMMGRADFVFLAPGSKDPRFSHWVASDAPNVIKRMYIC